MTKCINSPLKWTWESIEDLRKEYESELVDSRLESFHTYFKNMDTFERDILVLYSEYGSLRKVADETNFSYGNIAIIISCIKQDILKLQK